ncbi:MULTISPECIES: DASS family sodium-coupled anion symporter [unclassified Gilliamella]|uniref:DASS family sodium-coupled anion symporter n=1 Tax=unclassified Gilliamella TaxID=2685620 RepID=UPI00226AC7DA|nr:MULTISPECIES: DASS family sodium-coupled anion symporter [unclassified Gilliamella]MCX8574844.1 DASS family sodium-coupled anion symporter [Gilliamella sp. B3831]MCX8577168.1 DASS family sodium-coupled anion symporter [Gilliamella sp. B3815]MCX8589570.1 DASS family sodium-coupled anion symporter [Gilliamella sp. B3812]MCX8604214.1 DASS family sodium-coupled anion symporter [Gilliamella sp. B3823]MCX8605464.1 DASS family sodium-coupled anion symporter [Gilliamella sp. B3825]
MNAVKKPPVKWLPLIIIAAISAILWLFVSPPQGISTEGWRTSIIFVATIACIVAEIMPIGAIGLLAITVFAILRPSGAANATESIKISLSELNSSLIWLIVVAFMIARGFIKTGLSKRIAYYLVKILGKNTLGLAYGLAVTDVALAPAIPSTTARAGGVIYPIAEALSINFNSNPKDESRNRIGTFLMLTISHINDITSAMFLTAFTGNLLAAKLVTETLDVTLGWGQWFIAAIVPCLVSFIVIPLVIYFLTNPELKKTPDAPRLAVEELKKMGPITAKEIIMGGTVILLLGLWIFGKDYLGVDATTTAFIGLTILILTGVLSWDDVKGEKAAWDTLIWFAALLMIAGQVNKLGVTKWLGDTIGRAVENQFIDNSWVQVIIILSIAYVYLHYFFASGNAHIAALFPVFLSVAVALHVPPMIAIFALVICTNYFGSITQFANARNPLLFAEGFVPVKTWWKVGFICSVVNLTIVFTVGLLWWKMLELG